MKRLSGKTTLQQKLTIGVVVILSVLFGSVLGLHLRTVNVMHQMIYEQMESQADYYQQNLENEIGQILNLQIDFFNDRNLPFVTGPVIDISDYELRNSLLSVESRIQSIVNISSLVDTAVLYLPKSNYIISPSGIGRIRSADEAQMERYLSVGNSSIFFDEEGYYCVQTGESGLNFSKDPNYIFVIRFSSAQIAKAIGRIAGEGDGGAFLYRVSDGVCVEGTGELQEAGRVADLIGGMGVFDIDKPVQLKIDNTRYIAVIGSPGALGYFIQYEKSEARTEYIWQSWLAVTLFLLVTAGMACGFIWFTKKAVHEPMNELVTAFDRMRAGDLNYHIDRRDTNSEFDYLYREFNDTQDKLQLLIEDNYNQRNLLEKAQFKQLQNQINPHFLYNSFFILRRRIQRGDVEGAADIAAHLGDYFKYITRDGSDHMPLWQEIEHAKSYAAIQSSRFGERIQIEFEELPAQFHDLSVPRLILQPLLENSFAHGIENLESGGLIRIRFEMEEGLRIIVEDNGQEASDEMLENLRKKLDEENSGEITGLVNIHRRLKLCFGESAGLKIKRSSLGGLMVSVCIPEQES